MKLPSKIDLAVWGVVGLLLLGGFFVVKKWHHDAVFFAAEAARLQGIREGEKKQNKVSKEVSNDHIQAVAAINDPSRQLHPVRVCKPQSLPSVPEASGGVAPATSSGEPGLSTMDSGWEVSGNLSLYGKRCEVLRQTALSWRLWAEAQEKLFEETQGE